ncbi:MAG: transposase [Rhodobacteraceae bacterium]|nr:transposase [Paracoccaceae bacterium]
MGTKRTAEFRQEAVGVALTNGLTRKQVAADFGVGFSPLSKWIQQDRKDPEKPAVQSDLEREVVELRKENRLLREEKEALKRPPSSSRAKDPSHACKHALPAVHEV